MRVHATIACKVTSFGLAGFVSGHNYTNFCFGGQEDKSHLDSRQILTGILDYVGTLNSSCLLFQSVASGGHLLCILQKKDIFF